MKTSNVIVRAAVATSFLAALVVPAANAVSENQPNYGNSGKSAEEMAPAGSENGNGFGNGRNDYWGGCRGVHGGDNPGKGLGNGLGAGFNSGNGNGKANGHDKPWKQCPGQGGDDDDVEGSNNTLPQTR